jgi:Ni2+-binding GTPase involved in maturation of urease and hydrogenase
LAGSGFDNLHSMNHTPILIVLGGFLGAGKTTLILTAARRLRSRGLRSAAILNDQGSELVDTQYVRGGGIDADNVTGGCFCCRFSDLIDAAERLVQHAPDVIFAEAVGSCTDISATTLQPLKLHYRHEFRLAPYTVLVDPERARELSGTGNDLEYLFQKQIQEADLVCMTKSDLNPEYPELAGADVRYMSPLTGEGVDAWLNEVLASNGLAGRKILDIDYDRYARAEAGLAWLNCSVTVTLTDQLSPSMLVGPLLDNLDAALTSHKVAIVHLKVMDECPAGYVKASILRNGEEPSVQGILDASPAAVHELLVNIRATAEPHLLRSLVEAELSKLPGTIIMRNMQCFSPAAPKPEYRLDTVVVQA